MKGMIGHIRPMTKQDAAAVAVLHESRINPGFLSSLGCRFLKHLYAGIASSSSGFGFVWEESDGTVHGFIACAEDITRLYKQVLFRQGIPMIFSLGCVFFRKSIIKDVWDTLRYPNALSANLPRAEILAFAVSPKVSIPGIGHILAKTALLEFGKRRIDNVKLAVGAENVRVNRYWQHVGFECVLTVNQHGWKTNIHVLKGLTDMKKMDTL